MDKPKSKWKYADYKKNGICPSCKSKPPESGMSLCKACRDRRALPHNKHKQRQLVNNYKINNRSKGLCDRCKMPAVPGTQSCQRCLDRAKEKRDTIRSKIIEHYGGKCACCGETEIKFLTIDHINNDAPLERKNGHLAGGFYSSIIRRGFPDHYQILCWNCNCAKGKYGSCPHQKTEA